MKDATQAGCLGDFTFESDATSLERLAWEMHEAVPEVPNARSVLHSRAKWLYVGAVAALSVCGVLLLLVVDDRIDHTVFGLWGCVSGGVGAWMLYERQEANKGIKRFDEAARAAFERFAVSMSGRWRIAFFENRIEARGPFVSSEWLWTSFYGVDQATTYVILRGLAGHMAVPKSCFASQAQIDAFVTSLEGVIENHGGLVWQRIGRYLAWCDFSCMKCGYGLRGVDGRACPECGLKLTFQNVPGAFAAPMPPVTP